MQTFKNVEHISHAKRHRSQAEFVRIPNCTAVAVYCIRLTNDAKPKFPIIFQNTTKTTPDTGKTMSYIEKIMSDIIQTISDIFWPPCNTLKNNPLHRTFLVLLSLCKTAPYTNPAFSQLLRQQTALRRAPPLLWFLTPSRVPELHTSAKTTTAKHHLPHPKQCCREARNFTAALLLYICLYVF